MRHKKPKSLKILDTYEYMSAHAEPMPNSFFVTVSGVCEPLNLNFNEVQTLLETNQDL
jgi:hypothetical protein